MEGRGGFSLALLICLLAWQSLLTSAAKDQHGQLRERSRVAELPGQDFNLSFAHYTGYITVHPQTQRTLFYWFVEAAQDPSSKPLLLWLNGGATHLSLSLSLSLFPFFTYLATSYQRMLFLVVVCGRMCYIGSRTIDPIFNTCYVQRWKRLMLPFASTRLFSEDTRQLICVHSVDRRFV